MKLNHSSQSSKMKAGQKSLITQFFTSKAGVNSQPTEGSKEEQKVEIKPYVDPSFDAEEFLANFNDGRRIYHNRLKFYQDQNKNEDGEPALPTNHFCMLSFRDLFEEGLGLKETKENSTNSVPENVIVNSFIVEDSFIGKNIIGKGIECTMFKHGYSVITPGDIGKSVLDYPQINLRVILPDLKKQFSVFHPKVLLIKFNTFLRVVITTANMIEKDWEQLGQIIWFQDFPYTVEPVPCTFKSDLIKFFEDILPSEKTVSVKKAPPVYKSYAKGSEPTPDTEVPETGRTFKQIIRGELDLDKYDFSNSWVDLISSVSGYHDVESGEAKGYGMLKVSDIMSKCDDFKVTDDTQITYQCTSFGKIYSKMINEFIMSMFGQKINFKDIMMKDRLKFIFPEEKQVLESHLGNTVNCLKLREDFWLNQNDFPKFLFHKYEYKDTAENYARNVHHSKVMVIKDKNQEVGDQTAIYVGSHNMSGGAWGTLQRYGKTLYTGNYELGVFFRPREGTKEMKQRIMKSLMFKTDPTPYNLKVDKPYLFKKDDF